jgi:hypothetical protein
MHVWIVDNGFLPVLRWVTITEHRRSEIEEIIAWLLPHLAEARTLAKVHFAAGIAAHDLPASRLGSVWDDLTAREPGEFPGPSCVSRRDGVCAIGRRWWSSP